LLKIEASFLNENHIFVSNSLLWGNRRNWDSRPSLADGFVKDKELVESSESIPFSQIIIARTVIDNVAIVILRILDGVAHSVTDIGSRALRLS